MHRRSSALSRTTWRTIETTVAAEIRDAKEGRLWLKRRPVASRGSHLTLLCIMAKARCSVPVAAPESSHVLSTMTTEAPVRSGPAQNRAGRHRGSSPRLGVLSTPSRVGQPILNLMCSVGGSRKVFPEHVPYYTGNGTFPYGNVPFL